MTTLLTTARMEAIDRHLHHESERLGLPGLAVGIVIDQELAWTASYGMAEVGRDRPIDPDTHMRIASITKTFTAAAILQLRDAGKLQLDDPLEHYLPEFAAVRVRAGTRHGVTIRRLLTHHSGLCSESPLPSWSAGRFPTRDELLAALPATEITIPQDSAAKYSNLAFGLLGEVVARVSGLSYADYLHQEILAPLGMHATTLTPTAEQLATAAVGYFPSLFSDQLRRAPLHDIGGIAAAGQLYTTVSDLARWVAQQFRTDALARGPGQILCGTTITESQQPCYVEPDGSIGYGMTWRTTNVTGRAYLGHGGGIFGYTSYLLYSPAYRVGVICLGNVWPHVGLLGLASEVADLLIDGQIGHSPHLPPVRSPSPRATVEPPPPAVAPFLGIYESIPGIFVMLTYRAATLRLERSPLSDYATHAPALLEPDGDEPQRYIVRGGRSSGERITLLTDAHGRCSFTISGMTYHRLGAS
jgi:CubicO group peptidase (beta-lactamase class C family)